MTTRPARNSALYRVVIDGRATHYHTFRAARMAAALARERPAGRDAPARVVVEFREYAGEPWHPLTSPLHLVNGGPPYV